MNLAVSIGLVLTNVIDPDLTAVPAETLTECVRLCFYSTSCASLFYNHDTNQCYRSGMLYTVVPGHQLTATPNVNCYQWSHEGCPSQWSYSKPTGLCLQLFTSPINNDAARQTCEDNDGRLVNIQNSRENNLTRSIMLQAGNDLHIGLKKVSSVWRWHLGEDLGAFRSWSTGHPHLGNCVKMSTVTEDWFSNYCNNNRKPLCQIVLNNPYGDC
ncbi:uncharacterized protein [Haliotis asinina]|uniref:uncharacterized protein n=1 Tax=Haliotis asinina TaxID=109174 RepID=UPI003532121C